MIRIIIFVLFIFAGAAFCTVNREEITLRYFFGWETGPFPLFLLILAALTAGMIVGFSVGWGERWKLRGKGRDLTAKIEALREEIESFSKEVKEIPAPAPKPPEAEKSPPA